MDEVSATATTGKVGDVRVAEPASLEFREIHKHYGGLRAVNGVSAAITPGEIFGIAGSNGAGKTTLFDVLTGLTPATSGDVLLGGRSLNGVSVHHRCHLGMTRTFQQPTVTAELTVAENVAVAARFGRAREHWIGVDDLGAGHIAWALEWGGMWEYGDRSAGLLGVFDQKRLMLVTAMALGPRVLLMDEPFGGLNPGEIDATLDLVRSAAALGVTVVIIEHVMRALVQLAERVLVMHRGGVLFEGTPEGMLKDEKVIDIYLGRSQADPDRLEGEPS